MFPHSSPRLTKPPRWFYWCICIILKAPVSHSQQKWTKVHIKQTLLTRKWDHISENAPISASSCARDTLNLSLQQSGALIYAELRHQDVGSNIKAWAEACHIKGGGTPPSRVNESCSSETSTFRFIALFLRLWALTENRNPQKTAVLMLHLLGTTFCRGLIWLYGGCGGLRGLKRGEKCEKRLHFSPCVSGLSLLSLSPPTLITHHHSRLILHMCRHASNVCVCWCVAWSSSPVLLPPQRHTEGERSPCLVWPSVFLLSLIEAAERPPVGFLS